MGQSTNRVTIYHNPNCRKSREALQIIRDKGIEPTIIEYLKTPPSIEEISSIVKKMGLSVRDLFRKSEPLYKSLGLKNKDLSEEVLIEYLHKHPSLIERPIVMREQRAVLGRPPEDVKKIL